MDARAPYSFALFLNQWLCDWIELQFVIGYLDRVQLRGLGWETISSVVAE